MRHRNRVRSNVGLLPDERPYRKKVTSSVDDRLMLLPVSFEGTSKWIPVVMNEELEEMQAARRERLAAEAQMEGV